MWLSRELMNASPVSSAEEGITVSSGDGTVMEAGAAMNSRSVLHCQPYGYHSAIPKGERLILLSVNGTPAAVGTVAHEPVNRGEVKITSLGGASIHLKNDGSIVLNDALTITKEGEIIYGTTA